MDNTDKASLVSAYMRTKLRRRNLEGGTLSSFDIEKLASELRTELKGMLDNNIIEVLQSGTQSEGNN